MTSKITRKQIETILKQKYGSKRVDFYKGHTMGGRYGWIIRPFGQNEQFVGKTLSEAYEVINR